MSIVKTIAYMSTLIMAIVISWALTKSNIFVEGNTILALPWGIVTFVDLYIGFLYVGIWMVIREKLLHSILWIISLFFLGNLATSIFILYCIKEVNNHKVTIIFYKKINEFTKIAIKLQLNTIKYN